MMKIFMLILGLSFVLYAEETCVLKSSEPFGYTGDVGGKRVYTKEEFTYECTDTTTKRGACLEWEEQQEDYNVSSGNFDIYYESENFQGSIGEVFAAAQAYDKINGLWSGWHGICQKGADDGNWDWMSDPYVLAGYALSAFGASDGFGYADGNYVEGGTEFYSPAALAAQEQIVQYSVCAARAGLDVGKMMDEYNSDDLPCDPIDEFCDGEDDAAADNSNIFTVPEHEYSDMITNNPDMEQYMQILDGVRTGVLTIKVVNPNVSTSGLDAEAAAEAKKKAKDMALKAKAAMTTLQLASCVAGYDTGNNSGTDASSLLSGKNLALMALNTISPFIGIAASVAMNVVDSMTAKINTCDNEDDAKEKGSRHEATYHALPYGLCHQIDVQKSGKKTSNTYKEIYTFCCYDDKITRIIVEQAKAQFAKDWQHCTDITINELKNISFSSCDPDELDAGVNGTKLPAYAPLSQRMSAYQFTHKCIDTREFMAVTLEKFGGKDMLIDDQDVKEMLNDMK